MGVLTLPYENLPPEIRRQYFNPIEVTEYRNRWAIAEAKRKAADAEAQRKAEEAEAQRKAEEAEIQRKAEEAETQRKAVEEAAANRAARLASLAENVKPLRRDLNDAISDLKARWFPKRTKVENYDIIAKTMIAIAQCGGGNPFEKLFQIENNPYGLLEGDILGINAALQRNQPADTSSLESKIDDLASQNDRLRDQVQDAKEAARDASMNASDAAMDARDANREIKNAKLMHIVE